MADFGVTCVFGSVSKTVLLDANDKDVGGGRASSTTYTMQYWTADLPDLVYGSLITVDGVAYRVLTSGPKSDGKLSTAQLEIP